MTTGKDVLDRVLALLGYTDLYSDESSPQRQSLLDQGLAALNQAYSDLWFIENRGRPFIPLPNLEAPLRLSRRSCADILPYGTAMFLAQSEGDGDKQTLYAALYNQKRAAAPHRLLRRQDTLFGRNRPCNL